MTDQPTEPTPPTFDELVMRKLTDAETPGAMVEFDPDEADRAGAFIENAMSADDARAAEDGLESVPAIVTEPRGELIAAARNPN